MSLSAFDPICLERYEKPPFMLHFQWGRDELKVYRYALVEVMTINDIDHKLKQKEDERGLSQEEIWRRKYLRLIK